MVHRLMVAAAVLGGVGFAAGGAACVDAEGTVGYATRSVATADAAGDAAGADVAVGCCTTSVTNAAVPGARYPARCGDARWRNAKAQCGYLTQGDCSSSGGTRKTRKVVRMFSCKWKGDCVAGDTCCIGEPDDVELLGRATANARCFGLDHGECSGGSTMTTELCDWTCDDLDSDSIDLASVCAGARGFP